MVLKFGVFTIKMTITRGRKILSKRHIFLFANKTKNQVSLVQKVNNLCATSNLNAAIIHLFFSNSFIVKQENYRASIKLDKM